MVVSVNESIVVDKQSSRNVWKRTTSIYTIYRFSLGSLSKRRFIKTHLSGVIETIPMILLLHRKLFIRFFCKHTYWGQIFTVIKIESELLYGVSSCCRWEIDISSRSQRHDSWKDVTEFTKSITGWNVYDSWRGYARTLRGCGWPTGRQGKLRLWLMGLHHVWGLPFPELECSDRGEVYGLRQGRQWVCRRVDRTDV